MMRKKLDHINDIHTLKFMPASASYVKVFKQKMIIHMWSDLLLLAFNSFQWWQVEHSGSETQCVANQKI